MFMRHYDNAGEKQMETGFVLKITTIIAVIGMAGAIITAHFSGLATAREYADKRSAEVKFELSSKIDSIQADVFQSKTDIAVIREILEERYGVRKDKISVSDQQKNIEYYPALFR